MKILVFLENVIYNFSSEKEEHKPFIIYMMKKFISTKFYSKNMHYCKEIERHISKILRKKQVIKNLLGIFIHNCGKVC